MSQSLLDSVKEKAGKFTVSVERVVNLGNYETPQPPTLSTLLVQPPTISTTLDTNVVD